MLCRNVIWASSIMPSYFSSVAAGAHWCHVDSSLLPHPTINCELGDGCAQPQVLFFFGFCDSPFCAMSSQDCSLGTVGCFSLRAFCCTVGFPHLLALSSLAVELCV